MDPFTLFRIQFDEDNLSAKRLKVIKRKSGTIELYRIKRGKYLINFYMPASGEVIVFYRDNRISANSLIVELESMLEDKNDETSET